MNLHHHSIIVAVSDIEENQKLIKDTLDKKKPDTFLEFVENIDELLKYLKREGAYEELKDTPLPIMIMFDISDNSDTYFMQSIQKLPNMNDVPIIILQPAKVESDIIQSNVSWQNHIYCKPKNFADIIEKIDDITSMWKEITVSKTPEFV